MYKTVSYSKFRAHQNTFKSDDGEIKFIDEGQGNPILLLHGIPTSSWLYRKMITPLVKEGYRVIVPDMLGFGSSDSPKGYEIYNENRQAQRLIDLMNDLKINKWTHVFHDAGGLWTWELLKLQPNRIDKLVILNTIIYEEGFIPPVRFGKNFITKGIMKLYASKLFNGLLVKKLFDSGLTENTLTKSELLGYKTPLLEGKIFGLYYFFSNTSKDLKNYKPLLKTLSPQTLVIWGNNDPFLKWQPQAEQVMSDLKIATHNIHLLKGKHFIQESQPENICNFILSFLKG